MPTTPNYSWPTPASTDYVKDGATAIQNLGNAADATVATMVPKSLVDAKGDLIAATADNTVTRVAVGANNTVLTADSTQTAGIKWATVDAIPQTLIDAKGDLIVGTADNTAARLAVGANNTVLTADSTQAGGVKWAAASGKTWQSATGSLSGSAVNITGLTGEQIYLEIIGAMTTSASVAMSIRLNNDTANNYQPAWSVAITSPGTPPTNLGAPLQIGSNIASGDGRWSYLYLLNPQNSSGYKNLLYPGSSNQLLAGLYASTSVISQINIVIASGTFTAGTYRVWEYK